MSIVNGVVASVVGGVIGAAVWAGVTYLTEREIGWIAWGVGGLAGYGMSLGLQGAGDKPSGTVAALIAVLAVFGGKLAAVHLVVHKSLAEVAATPIGEMDMLVYLSDGVVEEWTAEGQQLEWPRGMTVEQAGRAEDYPDGVWDEARARYTAMSPAERNGMRETMSEERSSAIQAAEASIAQEGFVGSLSPYDLLWAGLAIATAFRLGSASKAAEATVPAA